VRMPAMTRTHGGERAVPGTTGPGCDSERGGCAAARPVIDAHQIVPRVTRRVTKVRSGIFPGSPCITVPGDQDGSCSDSTRNRQIAVAALRGRATPLPRAGPSLHSRGQAAARVDAAGSMVGCQRSRGRSRRGR
jgi:hypothetical protein